MERLGYSWPTPLSPGSSTLARNWGALRQERGKTINMSCTLFVLFHSTVEHQTCNSLVFREGINKDNWQRVAWQRTDRLVF